jgi:hypothetical protein
MGFLLMCMSLLAFACPDVIVKYPIGDLAPEAVEDLAEQFDGVWLWQGARIYVKCVADGTLQLGFVGSDKNARQFTVDNDTLFLTIHEDRLYMNIPETEYEQDTEYTFFRYTFATENSLVLWQPRAGVFASAVRNGELEGTVEDDGSIVRVTSTKDELLMFIRDERFAEQFEVEDPIVLRKLDEF